jgi:hypothetical protein
VHVVPQLPGIVRIDTTGAFVVDPVLGVPGADQDHR